MPPLRCLLTRKVVRLTTKTRIIQGMSTPLGAAEVLELPRGQHRNKALADYRRARAVEMKIAGHTCQQIADALNIANRGTVSRMINKALEERVAEDVDWLRAVGEARLMALLQAVWPQALAGHVPSVRTALHIVEALMSLHGVTSPKLIKDPKADWPSCQGPATLVIHPQDCRYEGCDQHGTFNV